MRFSVAWFFSMVALLGSSLVGAEPGKLETQSPTDQALAPISATSDNKEFARRTVTFTNGEPAGMLQDVIIDWATGQPEFGVLNLGDNILQEARATVVPWSLFRFGTNNTRPQLLVTKEQLQGAPKLPLTAEATHFQDPAVLKDVRQYYGARGSADSGLSGTLRGTDSSASDPARPRYLGAGSQGASVALYVAGALLVGMLAGRYLLSRRRTESHAASASE